MFESISNSLNTIHTYFSMLFSVFLENRVVVVYLGYKLRNATLKIKYFTLGFC